MREFSPAWQDDVHRQLDRLKADLVSRHAGILLTFALGSFLLPFWVIFFCYIALIGADIAQTRLLRRLTREPTRLRNVVFLAVSALTNVFYLLPAVLVWRMDDPLLKFLAFLAVVGALLNASSVRSAHLPCGIATGLPAALVALWMPLSAMNSAETQLSGALALGGCIALLGYFVSALLQNHRAQRDLVEVAERAREASAAKTRFLAAMDHEVRTPLNALLGHSQLLREATGIQAARGHAAQIELAARGLETLVEDVIDLSAAAEGKLQFRPSTVVIRPEIDRIERQILPLIGGSAARINTEVAPEVPEFGRFDPVLLRKCLTHLASIAISEHDLSQPIELNARCALAPGRKDRLRFTMAANKPAAVLHDASERPRLAGLEGETIGLALVNSIAGVMGANSAVLRAPDHTLVARIELPFVTVPDPPATGAETVYGRLRTLVVDDISSNRLVVAQMLRSLRIEATEAASGPDALERLATGEYDLVLLDMNMPDMDGEATLQSIRQSGATWANVPVVALTADTLGNLRDHYLHIGLNGFLTKPLDRRVLWSEILSAYPPPPPL